MVLPQYFQSLCCNAKDYYNTLLAFLCHDFTFNITDKKIDFRSLTFFIYFVRLKFCLLLLIHFRTMVSISQRLM